MAKSIGFIKVDICSAASEEALASLVSGSIDFWTKKKGYKLISDKKGNPDEITIYSEAAISDGEYVPGAGITHSAQVVLVYEKVIDL